jgi:hypothetical protein
MRSKPPVIIKPIPGILSIVALKTVLNMNEVMTGTK